MPNSLTIGGNLTFVLIELPLILTAQAAPCPPHPRPWRALGGTARSSVPAAALGTGGPLPRGRACPPTPAGHTGRPVPLPCHRRAGSCSDESVSPSGVDTATDWRPAWPGDEARTR